MTSPHQWILKDANAQILAQLTETSGLSPLLARVLACRDLLATPEHIDRFLNPKLAHIPSPFEMAGIQESALRVVKAVANHECIGVFGDYDVDGVASTVILSEFLEQLGARVVLTIPNRLKEGYGLNQAGIKRLQQQGAGLIITVDCGITAHEEIDYAGLLGLDVVVVDHHTVPVQLPNAVAVLNPHRTDCTAKRQHLCAAGVVFYLCLAIRQLLRQQGFFATRPEPNLKYALDLVAIATVADVVPLVEENRIFVQQGLQLIKSGHRAGIQALLQIADIPPHRITAGTLGFHIGPRINAAGRLEDASFAVSLLRSQESALVHELAHTLDEQNQARKSLEKQAVDEAIAEITHSDFHQSAMALALYREHWHPGVVGIVASRLVDRFGKPTLVIGSQGKGSGRSIPAFHLHHALSAVSSHLLGFGGHAHAVGLQLDPKQFLSFQQAFTQQAASMLKQQDLVRQLHYDAELDLTQISMALTQSLQRLAPFGRANPEPLFRINHVKLEALRPLNGGHMKGVVHKQGSSVAFIGFGLQDLITKQQGTVDVLAYLDINEWRNEQTLQLRLKDVQPS